MVRPEKNHETDVFMDDGDVAPSSISDQETKDGGWSNVKETIENETLAKEEKKEVVHDETIGPLDCSTPNQIIDWRKFRRTRQEKLLALCRRPQEKRTMKQPPEERKDDLKKSLSLLAERIREDRAKRDRPWYGSERIEVLIDPGTWDPMDEEMVSLDPIGFHSAEEPHKDRIDSYQEMTGLTDAVQTGIGQLSGKPVAVGVVDFQFMGGSIGSTLEEKITRLSQQNLRANDPLSRN